MKSRTLVGDFNGACANTAGAANPRSGIATPALRKGRRGPSGFFLFAKSLSPVLYFLGFVVPLPITGRHVVDSHRENKSPHVGSSLLPLGIRIRICRAC